MSLFFCLVSESTVRKNENAPIQPRLSRLLIRLMIVALPGGALASGAWNAPIRGGSNFGYYQWIDYSTTNESLNDSASALTYVVSNYNSTLNNPAFNAINAQLESMIAEGQRTIRIPIEFDSGCTLTFCTAARPAPPTDCSNQSPGYGYYVLTPPTAPNISGYWNVMDASGYALPAQCAANLQSLLEKIQALGFQYIEIGFFPEGGTDGDVTKWPSWEEEQFQINWNFIVNTRNLVRSSLNLMTINSPFFDLGNELANAGRNGGIPLEYMQALWANYAGSIGRTDTFGFSIGFSPGTVQPIVQSLNNIYGSSGAPYILEVHAGDSLCTGECKTDFTNSDDYVELIDFDTSLATAGIQSSFVIGEAEYYNSAFDAQALAAAAEAILTGPNKRQCFWLTQWPLDPTSSLPTNFDAAVSEPSSGPLPPASSFLSFLNFINAGW
jgi:hypothetical protein